MSIIVSANYGPGKQLQSFPDVRDFIAAVNLAGEDKTIVIYLYDKLVYNQANVGASPQPNNPDDYHNVVFLPAPGVGVNDLNKATLDAGTSVAEIEFGRDGRRLVPGLKFVDLLISFVGGNGDRGFIVQNNNPALTKYDVEFHNCRFRDKSTSGGLVMQTGVGNARTLYSNCLLITEGSQAQMLGDGALTYVENCRFVARGAGAGAPTALGLSDYGYVTGTDFIGFGATPIQGGRDANIKYSHTDSAAGARGAGMTVATTAQLVQNYAGNDYRPAGVAIGGGDPAFASTADMLGNNRGSSPDAGPWQMTPATPLPEGTITSQPAPDGQSLTVTFSTTNSPISGSGSLDPASANPNGATPITGVVTLGNGTGTASFAGIQPGNYALTIILTNAGGSKLVPGASGVSILGIDGAPEAPSVDTTPSAQVPGVPTNVSATAGNGSAAVTCTPPANGGSPITGYTVVASTGQSSSSTTLPVAITMPNNAAATFRMLATNLIGNSALSAPSNEVTPRAPAVVTGVNVSPAVATVNGGDTLQLSAVVQGQNLPSQAVTWATSAGTISAAGLLTAPAAANSTQTVTVTATSAADPTKTGTATIAVAASSVAVPPVATVNSVTVAPDSAQLDGGANKQFSATVNGTNSPPQGVTWATDKGVISADGLLTAPAATNANQSFSVTATSAADPTKSGTALVTVAAIVTTTPPPDTTPPPTATRVFSVQLTIDGENGAANLSGLIVRCYNGDGSLALSINNGTTDANGWVSVAAQSTLPVGGVGMMVVRGAGRHFADFVQVA